jgi:hypothetical protein
MKKRFLTLLVAGALVASCSKEEPGDFLYTGEEFVAFENINATSISISEDAGSAQIKIQLSKPQSVATTVTVSVEELELNVGYSIPSTQVVIPAGEFEGNFVINPVNDNLNSPATRLKITLTAATPDMKIGMREVGSYTKNVTIVNDDCPTKFNTWFGPVTVQDVGFGSVPANGSGNAAGACDILRVVAATNFVGWTAGAEPSINHDFTLVPDFPNAPTGVATIANTRIGQTNFNFPGAPGTPGEVLYTITYGEYNETTKIIEVDYQIRARQLSTGQIFSLGAGWAGTNRIIKP